MFHGVFYTYSKTQSFLLHVVRMSRDLSTSETQVVLIRPVVDFRTDAEFERGFLVPFKGHGMRMIIEACTGKSIGLVISGPFKRLINVLHQNFMVLVKVPVH